MTKVIDLLIGNSNAMELDLVMYNMRGEKDKEFHPTKVFSPDFISMMERNIKSSKIFDDNLKQLFWEMKKIKEYTKMMKHTKKIYAAYDAKNKMLANFIPFLKTEYNKVHTIIKLLYAVNKNISYDDVKENYSNLLNIPYFNNFQKKELKNFHILRSILIHQETKNVLNMEHWEEILVNFKNIEKFMALISEQYKSPINKKIESTRTPFVGDKIMHTIIEIGEERQTINNLYNAYLSNTRNKLSAF